MKPWTLERLNNLLKAPKLSRGKVLLMENDYQTAKYRLMLRALEAVK
jgi:hypothetical protein